MIKKLFIRAKSNYLFKNSVIFFVGSMTASVFSYLFHMRMGRMLSVAEYGELQSLISIYMIIFLPSTALTLVVTKFSSRNHRFEEFYKIKSFFKKLTKNFAFVGFLISLILIVFCKQISSFLRLNDPFEIIIFSLIFVFIFLLAVNKGVLQGFHFFKDLSWVVILETSSKLILGVILVWIGWKIYGAITAIVVGFAVSYLYSFFPLKKIFPKNNECDEDLNKKELSKDELKDLTKYAMPVVFSLLGVACLLSFDVILAKHYFAPQLAGTYGGLSIIGRVIYFATMPLAGVLFSTSSRQHKDGENYQRSFFLSFVFTLAISACAIFTYFVFPRLVIQTLLGGKYIHVAGYLGWHAIAISMLSLINLTVNFLLSIKMIKCVYLIWGGVLLQIIGIIIWHKNIWQLVFISNGVMIFILFILFIYFFSYEKHTWRSCFNS